MINQNTFTGTVTKIAHNAKFLLVFFNLDMGGSARTFAVPSYGNFQKWASLQPGDKVAGLAWFSKEKRCIDADSEIVIEKSSDA